VSPVKYELGFYIPEDAILHSDRREHLKHYNSGYVPAANSESLRIEFLSKISMAFVFSSMLLLRKLLHSDSHCILAIPFQFITASLNRPCCEIYWTRYIVRSCSGSNQHGTSW
jgi:hypothetical protein